MTTLRSLLERRADVVVSMRQLDGEADDEGALTDDQQAAFDKLKAALADLETAISRRAALDDAERRMAGHPLGTSGDRNLDRELRSFSLMRAIAAAAGMQVDAGRERELSTEIARRSGRQFQGIAVPMSALSLPIEKRVVTAGGTGGELISEIVEGAQMIDALRAALVIRGLGARIITGLTSNVDLPRLSTVATAGWVAENTTLTVSDEGFDHVPLRPHHAGGYVELSRNMLQQPSIDMEYWVRRDLAEVLARVLDGAAINGTGAANDPTGILNTSGIGSVAMGTNGGALTYNAAQDLRGQVADANAELGESMSFLGNTKVRRAAAKILDSYGHPLGLPLIFSDLRQAWTNLVPATLTKGSGTNLSALIYGNFSDLVIGLWSELDILVNPYETTAYQKGNVQVRAMMTVDIGLRHPQSFAAITDIIA